MERRISIYTVFASVAILLFAVAAANATTIATTLQGASSSPTWGEHSADAGVGNTFTLQPGEDTVLDSVTFYLDDAVGRFPLHTTIDFKLYVYEWDGLNNHPIPSALMFASPVLSTTGAPGWETFVVNTGGVPLATGTEYIWLISANDLYDPFEFGGAYYGFDLTLDPYPNGNFWRRSGGGCCLGALFNSPWGSSTSIDLAFTLELSAVPEPRLGLFAMAGLVATALGRGLRQRS